MKYHIPQSLKPKIDSFLNECAEHISHVLNSPVRIILTVHTAKISDEEIRHLVCTTFNVEWHEIEAKDRHKEIVAARMCYCYLAKHYLPGITLSKIAGNINKDHTTVINAIRTFTGYIDTRDAIVMDRYLKILDKIKNFHEPKEV